MSRRLPQTLLHPSQVSVANHLQLSWVRLGTLPTARTSMVTMVDVCPLLLPSRLPPKSLDELAEGGRTAESSNSKVMHRIPTLLTSLLVNSTVTSSIRPPSKLAKQLGPSTTSAKGELNMQAEQLVNEYFKNPTPEGLRKLKASSDRSTPPIPGD